MTQASISRNLYRMKIALPYTIYIIFFFFLTSVICFLVFTGITANNLKNTNSDVSVINSSDNLYRDLSFQATIISLLTIIAFCSVYYTLKNIV